MKKGNTDVKKFLVGVCICIGAYIVLKVLVGVALPMIGVICFILAVWFALKMAK